MSLNPSRVAPISNNIKMRIPCSTTQKWYYLRGTEDKDVEYGKLYLAVASPLSNVTGGSKTSVIVRIRWVFEFSFPDLPTSAIIDEEVFASSGNYFSDSSSDWKAGKYLSFKWHEGGDIVSFPGAKTGSYYKIGAGASVSYYLSNGAIANTKFAVCPPETAEDGLPMLAPVKDEATAKLYVKSPSDSYLLQYFSAGNFITPENPPWHEQSASVSLVVSREMPTRLGPMRPTQSTVRVSDVATTSLNKDFKTLHGLKGGNPRDPNFGTQKIAAEDIADIKHKLDTLLADAGGDDQSEYYSYLKDALEQMKRLDFVLTTRTLKVFNENPIPVSGDSDAQSTSSSCSFEQVGSPLTRS